MTLTIKVLSVMAVGVSAFSVITLIIMTISVRIRTNSKMTLNSIQN